MFYFFKGVKGTECIKYKSELRKFKFSNDTQSVKTFNVSTRALFTTLYQEYQARPGSMSVPVKS